MSEDGKVPLPNLEDGGGQADVPMVPEPEGPTTRIAADLEAVFDGTVLELDRKVGEAIDIYVNNRLVARGEVVLVEEKLGVTMTEIIKAERN
jgi:flagellar motor switch protein FliN/FliY